MQTLERWGIYKNEVNPVARTNVCPEFDKPGEPSLYAFSYTVPAVPGARKSFILAGGGDARGGAGSYAERIVRLGDTSPEALSAITMPTLVVCGSEDQDNGSAEKLVAALPNAKLATVPGTHMSSVTMPDLGEAIRDFLT